jgi:hypothetical protein
VQGPYRKWHISRSGCSLIMPLCGCSCRTRTAWKDLNPHYDEFFEVGNVPGNSQLQVEVWDKDLVTADDILGKASWVFAPQKVRSRPHSPYSVPQLEGALPHFWSLNAAFCCSPDTPAQASPATRPHRRIFSPACTACICLTMPPLLPLHAEGPRVAPPVAAAAAAVKRQAGGDAAAAKPWQVQQAGGAAGAGGEALKPAPLVFEGRSPG